MLNQCLAFTTWNVNGGLRTKIDDADFVNSVNMYDFISLVETSCQNVTSCCLKGYLAIHRTRKVFSKRKGGVALYYAKRHKKGVQKVSDREGCIWVKLDQHHFGISKPIYLCVLYIPPESSLYADDDMLKLEEEIIKFKQKGSIIISGDMNSRTAKLADYIVNDDNDYLPLPDMYDIDKHLHSRVNQDVIVNVHGRQLVQLCKSTGLRICNGRVMGDLLGRYTCYQHKGSSVVDYTLSIVDILDKMINFTVHPLCPLSDHCRLSYSIPCHSVKDTTKSSIYSKLFPLPPSYIWENQHRDRIIYAVECPPFQHLIKNFENGCTAFEDINEAVESFTNVLNTLGDGILKKRTGKKSPKRRNAKRWFDKSCSEMKSGLKACAKSLVNYPRDPRVRENYFKVKSCYRRLLKRKKKEYKSQIINEMYKSDSQNPQDFWKLLQDLKAADSGDETSVKYDIEDMLLHFKNLLWKPDIPTNLNTQPSSPYVTSNDAQTKLNKAFTIREVKNHIHRLKNNKASGIDMIKNELIKLSSNIILPSLTKLFNHILDSGTFLDIWNHTLISPIFKSGDKTDPQNYRGIAITSCLGKLFTSIINTRLADYLNETNIYSRAQGGFRKGFQTNDNTFILKTILDKYLGSNKKIYACFVDFQKAFDSVSHPILLKKLLEGGIKGKCFDIIQSLYATNKIAVRLENNISNFFTSNIGIKQGDGLSPTLFNVFINDLEQYFLDKKCDPISMIESKLSCLLYADDLLLLSESATGLQNCLDQLDKFCNDSELAINLKKTKVMIFAKKSQKSNPTFSWRTTSLEIVKMYKYLGLQITSNGTFNVAKEDLKDRARKAVFKIRHLLSSTSNITASMLLKIFDATVKPILTYGSAVWGANSKILENFLGIDDLDKLSKFIGKCPIENVQLWYCKQILQVGKKACNVAVLSEMGRVPVFIDTQISVLKLYQRLVSAKNCTLLHEAYKLSQSTKGGWVSYVEPFMHKLDIQLPNKGNFQAIKTKLVNCYITTFFNVLNINPEHIKLRTYRLFKKDYKLEPYLEHYNIKRHEKSQLAKFRISNHVLEIEKGRHKHLSLDARICPVCASGQIEDEVHFLMKCTKYKHQRDIFHQSVKTIKPDLHLSDCMSSFIKLMRETNPEILQKLSQYVYESFMIRQNSL
jgi:exonuclease III